MENHIGTLLQEAFDTTDLYQIMCIEKTADVSIIKQSYRKLALKYHPDRANGDAKKFQALSAAHAILSDEQKRKEYDETGGLDDTEMNGNDFDTWYEYFRNLFPAISTKSIDEFATKYNGSEEEKKDIIELYHRFQGDLFLMFNYIMCSDDEDSEERICRIIDDYLLQPKTKETNADNDFDAVEYPKYKKLKSKFLANKTKRLQSSIKLQNKKSKKSSSSSTPPLSLEQQIMQKQNSRANSMAQLFNKYTKGKGDTSGNDDYDEISDEAFLATQKKILSKKKK